MAELRSPIADLNRRQGELKQQLAEIHQESAGSSAERKTRQKPATGHST